MTNIVVKFAADLPVPEPKSYISPETFYQINHMNSELNEKLSVAYGFNNITFNNKSDYLLFVAQWKLAYKDLSRQIRNAKQYRKELQRAVVNKQHLPKEAFDSLAKSVNSYLLPTEIHGTKLPTFGVWSPRNQLTAQALLALRCTAKKVAGAQMQSARAMKAS